MLSTGATAIDSKALVTKKEGNWMFAFGLQGYYGMAWLKALRRCLPSAYAHSWPQPTQCLRASGCVRVGAGFPDHRGVFLMARHHVSPRIPNNDCKVHVLYASPCVEEEIEGHVTESRGIKIRMRPSGAHLSGDDCPSPAVVRILDKCNKGSAWAQELTRKTRREEDVTQLLSTLPIFGLQKVNSVPQVAALNFISVLMSSSVTAVLAAANCRRMMLDDVRGTDPTPYLLSVLLRALWQRLVTWTAMMSCTPRCCFMHFLYMGSLSVNSSDTRQITHRYVRDHSQRE